KLSVADRSQGQVPERAAPLPALEAGLRDDALRPSAWTQAGQRTQPFDAGDPMARLPPALGVEEVVGEHLSIGLGEAERAEIGRYLVGKHPQSLSCCRSFTASLGSFGGRFCLTGEPFAGRAPWARSRRGATRERVAPSRSRRPARAESQGSPRPRH